MWSRKENISNFNFTSFAYFLKLTETGLAAIAALCIVLLAASLPEVIFAILPKFYFINDKNRDKLKPKMIRYCDTENTAINEQKWSEI